MLRKAHGCQSANQPEVRPTDRVHLPDLWYYQDGESMKKVDLAYAAGIIDGEGSIGIARHSSKSCKRGYSLELCVQVTSSDEWLCTWLKFAFGGSLSHSINSADNPMWHWIIGARKASEFLKLILPYLKLKHSQAELAIIFQSAKRIGLRKSDEEMAVEEAQRLILQNMHRGKSGSHKGLKK